MKYVFIGAFVLILMYVFWGNKKEPQKSQVTVSTVSYKVIHADTDELRTKGLSGRTSLEKDTVMLFSFPTPGVYGFWMKDMLFPIDILWTNEAGDTVQHIERNLSPDTYPKAFYPPEPSKYVLEIAADGFKDVQVGDKVKVK